MASDAEILAELQKIQRAPDAEVTDLDSTAKGVCEEQFEGVSYKLSKVLGLAVAFIRASTSERLDKRSEVEAQDEGDGEAEDLVVCKKRPELC